MIGELNEIVAQLEASVAPLTGEVRELDGGITNRNFRVTLGGADYVVRRPGRDTELLGIDRDAERIAGEAAAALGIAPRVAAALDGCLVSEFVDGESLAAADVAAEVAPLARALRAFHESHTRLPARFHVPELLDSYAGTVRALGGTLPEEYASAREAAARIAAVAPLRDGDARPCHNDLLCGNLIRARDGRVLIVDWEYAAMGDPRFDLGNLAAGGELDEDAEERLLLAYYGEPPSERRRAELGLMRVLSDAREAAWGTVQAHVSALDFDFRAYALRFFERLRATVATARFEQWLAAAGEAR